MLKIVILEYLFFGWVDTSYKKRYVSENLPYKSIIFLFYHIKKPLIEIKTTTELCVYNYVHKT